MEYSFVVQGVKVSSALYVQYAFWVGELDIVGADWTIIFA